MWFWADRGQAFFRSVHRVRRGETHIFAVGGLAFLSSRQQLANSAGGATDLGAHGRERRVGVLAEGRDRREADHDDEGQHDRILNRGRAVFTLKEIDHCFGELTHDVSPGMIRLVKEKQ
jgi:hypothetical protein